MPPRCSTPKTRLVECPSASPSCRRPNPCFAFTYFLAFAATTHARNASNSRTQSFFAISDAFPRTHPAYFVTYSSRFARARSRASVTHEIQSTTTLPRARAIELAPSRTCDAHADDDAINFASGDGARDGIDDARARRTLSTS